MPRPPWTEVLSTLSFTLLVCSLYAGYLRTPLRPGGSLLIRRVCLIIGGLVCVQEIAESVSVLAAFFG